MIPKLSHSAIY